MKKRKTAKKEPVQTIILTDVSTIDDVWEAERDFAELVTEHWELISENAFIHAKAMKTAIKLRELRSILGTTKRYSKKVN